MHQCTAEEFGKLVKPDDLHLRDNLSKIYESKGLFCLHPQVKNMGISGVYSSA